MSKPKNPSSIPVRVEFFNRYLEKTPIALAFWRSFECHSFSLEKLKSPVLDVGCGDGFFAHTAFGEKLETGIDLDGGEVSRARRSGSYGQALRESVTQMPFADRTYRTVISNCVLEHVPNIDLALKEIHRVLKPGGRLLITVPSEHFNQPFFRRFLEKIKFPKLGKGYIDFLNKIFKHFHVDDAGTWGRRLRKAGFLVEKADQIIPLEAFQTYERWMAPAFPSKILKVLFGRWVLGPREPVKRFASRWVRQSFPTKGEPGACYFIAARRK